MGKRLIRVFQAQLSARTSELLNREINVVLKSDQTFFGRCLKIENQLLFLEDQRMHLHTLAFTQIDTVVYDQSATF
ncbi:hypothetical protein [Runella slithyformis]|uniref:DUF2642 domain-containing protein n=1 Tax=Runella slithyformis (strain ATCC 29530 / DSM 19594 / LMG 11500 / NCIMB 11436 / LSU 4) TaxID=761193 RepID=A0A7U3ZNQ7_RUNSL|nr:hypothetical protein [Runella slithyformis]AEI50584.1 hypothetical protein Runsl_4241 [Runella slithyformis DSM 19594]